jgi:hypothetical protein
VIAMAERCAQEAAALDREAAQYLHTKLRDLFTQRERMLEASEHEQALDLAFLRKPMTPGPRGPQPAAPLGTRFRTNFDGWVHMLLGKKV